MGEVFKGFPRIESTERELSGWLTGFPNDESLLQEAEFMRGQVSDWGYGKSAEDTLRALFRRYYSTDGQVSDETSTVLMQSTMWFEYESDFPTEASWRINQEELQRVQDARDRRRDILMGLVKEK